MDASAFLPSLASVLTTALIAFWKERSIRTFETRTKRVDFWKKMLETAPLVDVKDVTFIKEQCQTEIAEAVDAVAIEKNKFVGELSTIITYGFGTLVILFVARAGIDVLDRMQQQGVPVQRANQFASISAIVQAVIFVTIWFWGRGRVRRWIWNQIKPGAPLEAVRENKRLQGGVGLLACFLVMGALWLSLQIPFATP